MNASLPRTVVVTGGGTGLGRATAAACAAAGDDVLIVGRRGEVLRTAAAELGVRSHVADLTDPAQVAGLAAAVGGPLDLLVNNAGATAAGPGADLEAEAERWRSCFAVNVLTAVLTTTALAPLLRRPGGRIVTVSSIAAADGGGEAYGAAKAALISWNRALAARLGPDGITANVVAPGYVPGTEFFGDGLPADRHQVLVDRTLLGRAGRPGDVAAAILAFAGPAGEWTTGQALHVNGGAHLS